MPGPSALSPAMWQHCEELVRTHDRDRHVASLFAPARHRQYLHAVHAFAIEIARVRDTVSDPLPGEIRLQWWRDMLRDEARGDASSHPVAAALTKTIAECRLPLQPFLDLIEARTFDLYDDIFPEWIDLEGYCGETSSNLTRLATLILAEGAEPNDAEAAGYAGVAYALTGLLRAFPWHARRGTIYLPQTVLTAAALDRADIVNGRDSEPLRAALAEMRRRAREHLRQARERMSGIATTSVPAFLPLSTVETYLTRMEKADYQPFATIIDIAHWRRLWLQWRQAEKSAKQAGTVPITPPRSP